MTESMLKKVKTYFWPQEEKRIFGKLLESLQLDDRDIAHLAEPVEESIRKEARKKYALWCLAVLIAAAAAAVFAVFGILRTPLQNDGLMAKVWIVTAAMCGGILLLLWGVHGSCDVTSLVSDKRKLLYLRFVQEGSLGGLLGELADRSSVVVYGQDAEEAEKQHRLFGPWAARAAALLMVLINVALGVATVRGMFAVYEPTKTGVALVSWSNWTDPSGTVVIPSEQDGKPVTTICKLAFENRRDVKRIIVPDTVTVIDSGAFRGCTSLEEVVLPDTLTTLGAEVFYGCRALKTFTLPAGVTEIRADTFRDCTQLSDVRLHEGLKMVHAGAFSGCMSLGRIVIPAGVEEIGANAFLNCTSLSDVQLPDGLKTLGADVFAGCTALEGIKLPEGLKEVPARAFNQCKKLKSVVLPASVTKISERAFEACTSLTSFHVPKSVTKLSAYAFYGCTALEEILLPDGLEEGKIGEGLFQNCTSLRAVVIPEGVWRISAHAFRGCTQLSSVTVPGTLQEIGSSAFRDCSSLNEILLPGDCKKESNSFKDSPTKITYMPAVGEYTVKNGQATLVKWGGTVNGAPSVVVPAEYNGVPVTAIGDEAFKDRWDIEEVVLPDTITMIGENAFYNCKGLRSINLPQSLKTIKSWAFAYCGKLRHITIPAGVKLIDGMAFYEASLADGVVMPESMPGLDIGWAAFKGTQLKSIMLPEGLERVSGFNECGELIAVRIPNSVQTIGFNAFDGCRKLNTVQMPEVMGKWGLTIEEQAFRNCRSLETITLPQGCKVELGAFEGSGTEILYFGQTAGSAGSAHTGSSAESKAAAADGYELRDGNAILLSWRGSVPDGGTVEIPAAYNGYPVTEIGTGAFSGRTDIAKVVLPDTITVIGSSAFKGCSLLGEINMPAALQEIGQSAFANCIRLESLTLPEGLKTIGTYAFQKCKRLAQVSFPASLEKIARKAFEGCPLLTLVAIPDGCDAKSAFDKGVTVEFLTPAVQ